MGESATKTEGSRWQEGENDPVFGRVGSQRYEPAGDGFRAAVDVPNSFVQLPRPWRAALSDEEMEGKKERMRRTGADPA
jgi:hypothetical protein